MPGTEGVFEPEEHIADLNITSLLVPQRSPKKLRKLDAREEKRDELPSPNVKSQEIGKSAPNSPVP